MGNLVAAVLLEADAGSETTDAIVVADALRAELFDTESSKAGLVATEEELVVGTIDECETVAFAVARSSAVLATVAGVVDGPASATEGSCSSDSKLMGPVTARFGGAEGTAADADDIDEAELLAAVAEAESSG